MGRYGSQDGAVDPDNEEPHFGPDAVEPCWLSLGEASHIKYGK